ncbi:MAG: tRNA preQ1(34) S-adenosylmethionine ribosyltransferase-isomerase QueA [Phycisphaerae bacterium]|nr:tRNA preQ1(34) S-adenosylmethionine ribosyltransferase-isomerase QueA [Phycisphaerae bacterium]MBT6270529.1 tRNA preQ1(34) S-adenosylmethionine ribosyltransferase-isomerase QueA [Phycisphaerae bacterium]MBT6282399.1 tRNA preQ1(34) S-adenosylmethionine ribosyltransferase-isomerase QueA [Phycisphaerae bacterium]
MTISITLEDLEYDLPNDCIATHPVSPRSSAKLLVVKNGTFLHKTVSDLASLLPKDALLVVNETAVLPARFKTSRAITGGKGEGLFLKQHGSIWEVMLKSNGKLRKGVLLELQNDIQLELLERVGKNWMCTCSDSRDAREILQEIGTTPIPPYILSARGDSKTDDLQDREHYQTVYADTTQNFSVAAPTAGLHFDEQLLLELETKGIQRVPVTLHVGPGTFKGIETPTIEEHEMHEENWEVCQASLDAIKEAKVAGRPVIAIGTTSVRTLESLPPLSEWPEKGGLSGATNLMITPPYDFDLVDGMLTNFHLPKSTLLTLVASMLGMNTLKLAYAEAIRSGYRFYSYGDAMFFLSQ